MTCICPICVKLVSDSCPSIFCESCNLWVHQAKCSSLSLDDFESYCKPNSKPWFCPKCINISLPFHCGNHDCKQPQPTKTIPSVNTNLNDEMKHFFSNINDVVTGINDSFDNNELSSETQFNSTSCKYYEYQDFNIIDNINSTKSFSVFHHNIASMAKHFDELKALLSLLQHNFSAIGITETRFLKNQEPVLDFSIPGYSALFTSTESNAGGVSLYISNSFVFKPRPDLDQVLYLSKNIESVFAEILLPRKTNIIIGTIYRHPSMSIKSFNDEYLKPFLHKISLENKQTILLGDFNINLLNSDVSAESSSFLDILGSNQIVPRIFIPTRITKESKTLIDNIFSNVTEHSITSGNIIYSISDHLPQFCIFNSSPKFSYHKKQSIFRQDWSHFDQENFILEYFNLDWNLIFKHNNFDPDLCFNNFDSKMKDLLDRHIPTVKITKRQLKTKLKPWITSGILKSISRRDFFFRKFINCKNPENKNKLHKTFKTYRNMIVSLTRRSKSNYYTNYFNSHCNNMQKIWAGIRSLISSKLTQSKPISLNIGESVISDPNQIADCFNDFFTTIADNIRRKIPPTRRHFSSFMKKPNPKSFFVSPVSKEEVIEVINSFSPSKSTGPNSIPIKILKLLVQDISEPITTLVNISFINGTFPSILKTSKVTPIFKKGSPLEVSNYRPISLLSNIEKIYEKLMYSRLISFLNNQKQIYTKQFGFRKSHSTTHTLINIVEQIRKSLDKNEFACGVFVDLQKAFDTVDHEILLSKLKHYGVRGIAHKWFQSYLSGRTQFVSIRDVNSSSRPIKHGVPQGSVLGPLLFLLYINDLHFAISSSETYHFADDTHLLNFSHSVESLTKKVNADLKALSTWLNANKISLNPKKTEFIVFYSKNKNISPSTHLKLLGQRIYPSQSVKYLGVHLDAHLNWKTHISTLANKLQRSNGALYKLRHFMPLNTLVDVYHAIFSSHMRYACQVWGLRDNSITHRILILQKAALRIITFSNPLSASNPIFFNLGILKIFDLVEVLNIQLVHRYLNRTLPFDTLETLKFEMTHHLYDTRNNSLRSLKLQNARTSHFGLNSLTRLATQQWNRFQKNYPTNTLSDLNTNQIKSLATKFYFKKYMY